MDDVDSVDITPSSSVLSWQISVMRFFVLKWVFLLTVKQMMRYFSSCVKKNFSKASRALFGIAIGKRRQRKLFPKGGKAPSGLDISWGERGGRLASPLLLRCRGPPLRAPHLHFAFFFLKSLWTTPEPHLIRSEAIHVFQNKAKNLCKCAKGILNNFDVYFWSLFLRVCLGPPNSNIHSWHQPMWECWECFDILLLCMLSQTSGPYHKQIRITQEHKNG